MDTDAVDLVQRQNWWKKPPLKLRWRSKWKNSAAHHL